MENIILSSCPQGEKGLFEVNFPILIYLTSVSDWFGTLPPENCQKSLGPVLSLWTSLTWPRQFGPNIFTLF